MAYPPSLVQNLDFVPEILCHCGLMTGRPQGLWQDLLSRLRSYFLVSAKIPPMIPKIGPMMKPPNPNSPIMDATRIPVPHALRVSGFRYMKYPPANTTAPVANDNPDAIPIAHPKVPPCIIPKSPIMPFPPIIDPHPGNPAWFQKLQNESASTPPANISAPAIIDNIAEAGIVLLSDIFDMWMDRCMTNIRSWFALHCSEHILINY